MYKLVIQSKQLLDDNKHIEAVYNFCYGSEVLKEGIVVKATADSFEQTALEVGEAWARNFELLNNVKKEIPVNLEAIDKEREELRERERVAAEEATKNISTETIEQPL